MADGEVEEIRARRTHAATTTAFLAGHADPAHVDASRRALAQVHAERAVDAFTPMAPEAVGNGHDVMEVTGGVIGFARSEIARQQAARTTVYDDD